MGLGLGLGLGWAGVGAGVGVGVRVGVGVGVRVRVAHGPVSPISQKLSFMLPVRMRSGGTPTWLGLGSG